MSKENNRNSTGRAARERNMGIMKREDLKANRNILRQILIEHEEKDRGILAHTIKIRYP